MKFDPVNKYYDGLKREMMEPLRQQIATQTAAAMAGKFDDEIRKIADELLPGWTMEELSARFHFTNNGGANVTDTLYFDGVPVAKFGPMKMHTVQKDQSWVTTVTRTVKRL